MNKAQWLEWARKKGGPNVRILDYAFIFAVTSISTPDVDVTLFSRIGPRISDLAHERSFSCELAGISCCPILVNPAYSQRQPFIVNKRSENAFLVGRAIDIGTWGRARLPGRMKLARHNLRESLEAISAKRLSAESREAVLALADEVLVQVAAEMKAG